MLFGGGDRGVLHVVKGGGQGQGCILIWSRDGVDWRGGEKGWLGMTGGRRERRDEKTLILIRMC